MRAPVLATQALPASAGVPASAAAGTVVVRWNDPDALIAATERHELAAILAEPLPANMGLVAPQDGFFELLRERADANGALLVLDEVISGFRVARGGAQELAGRDRRPHDHGQGPRRRPARGGGGRQGRADADARALRRCLPGGDAVGEPARRGRRTGDARVARRVGISAPRTLTDRLAAGLRDAAAGYPVQVASAPGLLTVFFSDRPVRSFEDARACDLDAHGAWCRELLSRGVYPPPSQFEAWFPSLAHTPTQIERTVEVAAAAFASLGWGPEER